MAKRFRKAFIVCEDNQIFGHFTHIVIYKTRENAEFACIRAQAKAHEEYAKMWNANKPMPTFKVHAFYLLHEKVFRD